MSKKMPRQKSFEYVPDGYEVIRTEFGPEIMKRVTIYMTPVQIEFFRILAFELNCRKNWVIQEAIKQYMENHPDIVKRAEENLKLQKKK